MLHQRQNKHVALAELPIVAIHGSASNGGIWKPLVDRFANRRVLLTPDLIGYGQDEQRRLNPRSTLEERARPIIAAVSNYRAGFHLVAHSFGASVALQIASSLASKIGSLTFYEPVVPALLRDSGQARDMAMLGDLLALSDILNRTTGSVGMETFINFWGEPDTWQSLPSVARERLSQLAPVVYQDFLEAHLNARPGAFQSLRFHGPVRLLLGERATPHAVRMAELVSQRFPQARTKALSGMGHMGPSTHPTQVHACIAQHILQAEANCPSAASGEQFVINPQDDYGVRYEVY